MDKPLSVQATPTGDLDHVKLLEKYGLAYKVLSDPNQRNEHAEQIRSGGSEDGAMQQMPAQIKQVLGDREVSSKGCSSRQIGTSLSVWDTVWCWASREPGAGMPCGQL